MCPKTRAITRASARLFGFESHRGDRHKWHGCHVSEVGTWTCRLSGLVERCDSKRRRHPKGKTSRKKSFCLLFALSKSKARGSDAAHITPLKHLTSNKPKIQTTQPLIPDDERNSVHSLTRRASYHIKSIPTVNAQAYPPAYPQRKEETTPRTSKKSSTAMCQRHEP